MTFDDDIYYFMIDNKNGLLNKDLDVVSRVDPCWAWLTELLRADVISLVGWELLEIFRCW